MSFKECIVVSGSLDRILAWLLRNQLLFHISLVSLPLSLRFQLLPILFLIMLFPFLINLFLIEYFFFVLIFLFFPFDYSFLIKILSLFLSESDIAASEYCLAFAVINSNFIFIIEI
jgi:hypothetical protein